MATYQDDVGIWNELGSVVPDSKDWLKFPIVATGANATIRVWFESQDFEKVKSFIWLRSRYQTSNSDQVSQSIRVYPQTGKQIIQVPIPQDLQDRSIYFRAFEIKKQLRYRKYIGTTNDVDYLVYSEELWG